MLVLGRKVEESIIIDGGKIKIKVLRIEHGRVRLGIEAPKDISVDREEIWIQKQESKNDDST